MRLFWTILGFLLATVVGAWLSVIAAIGSQGTDSHTPVLPMLATYIPMFAIAHGAGAAVGLVPVAVTIGARAWRFGVCGFAAGGVFEGLLFPLFSRASDADAWRPFFIAAYFAFLMLPLTGGVSGLFLESRFRTSR